ncbi:TPA: UDP-3-O-(3-hydroxymyristoyl)glucosamine N-acyltransferase [Legionella pneumophila]|uniref:UDP-3-O-(3-hydroxymyristoyl)glucosamine N-acyltransferase n=1 Tax=Legionella pneumophila TaxID=446 RepID=A0A2S6F5Z2_LEGPN|nr:UDP-3-O-(3-hydroxymyristoyl)glucosamine N-acyltransferase [Legionella pneumophila]APF02352.1 UDP-3-O-(3-hydroxymyristoyl)glucosamine N-acyltransferase [Legionella pneumophila subsp. fraseri]APF05362.1 UDP-3-O-(3-hydroxymyristoyl)glucosamine N-acyltransferase [Legionella pneumophila subsp. fraseri]AUB67835.1 UDP-3-O-(3-hydroxymyristoyl)glucosamine N-acyltransferase [Legionella pneumophila]AUB70806.1 UDP-3-O-(3-hydroxymyristoyl)glucosamine N-acyltransferase [Legionella pneumophila]KXB27063.1 
MLTLEELANYLNGVWHGNANHAIFSVSSLARASSKDLAYFDNPLLQSVLNSTRAGAVLLKSEHLDWSPVNCIVVPNPSEAMFKAAKILPHLGNKACGIHPTAQVHKSAQLGQHVSVGANSVIGENVQLDDNVTIGSNTTIECSVLIGRGSQLGSGSIIHSGTVLGQSVIVGSGCIVGAAPFNYYKEHGVWQQGPIFGGVVIGQRTQIGANTVIHRGCIGDTYLGDGVCIDSLVLIAHDVYVGNNTAIAGCAAIGALVQIGMDCIIGGASCLAANIRLTNDVVITGMSTVTKSITRSGVYSSGTTVHEHHKWRRNTARFRHLDDYITKLKTIEKKLNNNN